jgi:hypothetical protein
MGERFAVVPDPRVQNRLRHFGGVFPSFIEEWAAAYHQITRFGAHNTHYSAWTIFGHFIFLLERAPSSFLRSVRRQRRKCRAHFCLPRLRDFLDDDQLALFAIGADFGRDGGIALISVFIGFID